MNGDIIYKREYTCLKCGIVHHSPEMKKVYSKEGTLTICPDCGGDEFDYEDVSIPISRAEEEEDDYDENGAKIIDERELHRELEQIKIDTREKVSEDI